MTIRINDLARRIHALSSTTMSNVTSFRHQGNLSQDTFKEVQKTRDNGPIRRKSQTRGLFASSTDRYWTKVGKDRRAGVSVRDVHKGSTRLSLLVMTYIHSYALK